MKEIGSYYTVLMRLSKVQEFNLIELWVKDGEDSKMKLIF